MRVCLAILFFLTSLQLKAQSAFAGKWTLLKDSSDFLSYFTDIELEIQPAGDSLRVNWTWQARNPHVERLTMALDHRVSAYQINNRVWPYQNFQGINYVTGAQGRAQLVAYGALQFTVQQTYQVRHAQGSTTIHQSDQYEFNSANGLLTVTHKRNNRTTPVKFVFYRTAEKHGWVHALQKDWHLKGGVGENAFFISLQGLANRDTATLYLDYSADWEYKESGRLRAFYERRLGYQFQSLNNAVDACNVFRNKIAGYILWDEDSRASLCVALTMAGLKQAVVARSDMKPMLDSLGLHPLADLRGKFNSRSDYTVFKELYEQYKDSCNRDFITWMGGAEGDQIMPGIADFGIARKTLFIDLSTDPKDTLEYQLADRIMQGMHKYALVMGWHSYGKDLERHYVTMASRHALRVEGLNTFPNLSFTSKTPPSPGFQFKNHNNINPNKPYVAANKVYISCVQTDGLGLGSWNSPERGSIPYAWEVTINWYWMAPVLLQYYYENATRNDYFFGALSGPGYMYPKAIPSADFLPLMRIADTLCRKLDLNVFETMDYSEGSSGTGNNDLPRSLVAQYFKAMPDMIGMLNGYAPSGTFGKVNGKPFISYDYYLDESIPESTAIADLNELIQLNAARPYFLALHVREWNDIERVKRILRGIKAPHDVVPLDVFLKLAAGANGFKEYYRPE